MPRGEELEVPGEVMRGWGTNWGSWGSLTVALPPVPPQGEVCSAITSKYSEFLPSARSAEELVAQVDGLSGSIELLRAGIEEQVGPTGHPPAPGSFLRSHCTSVGLQLLCAGGQGWRTRA